MLEHDIPGLALAVVDRDGVVWAQGFGYTDRDKRFPVTTRTPFSIQSTSKTVTTTAILLAVQDGLLDLDAPITRYVPGFTVQSRFGPDQVERITLRRLLSHRAGFTHEAPVGNNYDADGPSLADHVASISRTWLRFPVGQRFSYSNLGMDLAGRALENASGKPIAAYLGERLLAPLGMVDSTFDQEIIGKRTDRAVGHTKPYDEIPWRIPMVPAGGCYASAADMARFIRFHLNRGEVPDEEAHLLRSDLVDEMVRIQWPIEGQDEGYALGVGLGHRNGRLYLSHSGGGYGFLSETIWYPEAGMGIVVLTNSSDHPLQGVLGHEVLDAFLESRIGKAVVSSPQRPPSSTSAADGRTASRLVGSYVGRSGLRRVEQRGAELFMVAGDKAFALQLVSPTEAYWLRPEQPARYRFALDDGGRPLAMVRVRDNETFDYNDGPQDPPGPSSKAWDRLVGEYETRFWGQVADKQTVERKNGYLYYGDLRLTEYEPGLFFTAHGEALDLRSDPPTYASISLSRAGNPGEPGQGRR